MIHATRFQNLAFGSPPGARSFYYASGSQNTWEVCAIRPKTLLTRARLSRCSVVATVNSHLELTVGS
jgi:hypothetical protein